MSYRNKTYIIFDADMDIRYYRLMMAWKENTHIEFDFHNAHIYNNLTPSASEEQIKKKLRERMSNTKQVIVLVGEKTRYLYKYVRWEIEAAQKMDLPIIAVNLDNANNFTEKTPPILRASYYVSVPFEVKKIKYALDKFPSEYHKNKNQAPSDRYYNWARIEL
ncbi:TIR domain-containing protein [Aeromonas jandaei]|uniref:TIR domain-containing protein n=1 Tax=Aeromonas jandaei TaxID=650 RepID=UPI001ADDCBD5|nr:TIR domain-containing protein [Aeromonas jandaei]